MAGMPTNMTDDELLQEAYLEHPDNLMVQSLAHRLEASLERENLLVARCERAGVDPVVGD